MYKIALCDDEQFFIDMISKIIRRVFKEFDEDFQIDTFSSGEALLEKSDIDDYDMFFIDCDLKTMSGLDLAHALRLRGYEGIISFVTSYVEYAPDGYNVNAFRYILKSNLEMGLRECIKKIIISNAVNYFEIPSRQIRVKMSDIMYFESNNHKVVLHLENGKEHILYQKLNNIEKDINDNSFIRAHQSYLVNKEYITNISKYSIALSNALNIPVARSKYKEVWKILSIEGLV